MPRSTDECFVPKPPKPAGDEPIIEEPPHVRRRREHRTDPPPPTDPATTDPATIDPATSIRAAPAEQLAPKAPSPAPALTGGPYFRAGPTPRRHRRQGASALAPCPVDPTSPVADELPVLFARWHPVPTPTAPEALSSTSAGD